MQNLTTKHEKKFCLCVDDFGIKYHSTDDADHKLNALKEKYTIVNNREGKNFCGLTFYFNYKAGCVDMEMPGYVSNELEKLQHTPKVSTKYYPNHHTGFKYFTPGTQQYATATDETPTLSKQYTTFVQYIVVSLLYYGRSLDGTIIPAQKISLCTNIYQHNKEKKNVKD